jgi:hypothetical protein
LLFIFFLLNDLIDAKTASDDLELLRFLSCIFFPRSVRKELLKKRMQCSVEDSVPLGVKKGIEKFNEFVRERYCAFSANVSRTHSCALPLSNFQIGSAASQDLNCSVSLFARTSGFFFPAQLSSIDHLACCMRSELVSDHSSIPIVPQLGETYNSFLLDFYKMESPSIDVIVLENGLKDAWELINSFSSVLQVVATSLTLMQSGDERRLREMNVFVPAEIAGRRERGTPLLETLWRLSEGFKEKCAKVRL